MNLLKRSESSDKDTCYNVYETYYNSYRYSGFCSIYSFDNIYSSENWCFKLDEINVIHGRMIYLYAYLISLKISVCETYLDKNLTLWNLEQS